MPKDFERHFDAKNIGILLQSCVEKECKHLQRISMAKKPILFDIEI